MFRLIQHRHVIGYNTLEKRARVLSLNFQQAPVRKVIAHKLPRGVFRITRVLAVPPDTDPSWSWYTWEKGYTQTSGFFPGVNTEAGGGRQHSPSKAQNPHDVQWHGSVLSRKKTAYSTKNDSGQLNNQGHHSVLCTNSSILKSHNALLDNIGARVCQWAIFVPVVFSWGMGRLLIE